MTHPRSPQTPNPLNFTNLFARLKNNLENTYHPQLATRSTLFKTRQRPKSMYVVRNKGERQNNGNLESSGEGRRSLYGSGRWFSATVKENGFKARLYTEGSSSMQKIKRGDKNSCLKYLALNNFCLKKIAIPTKLSPQLPQSQSSPKIKVKDLKIALSPSTTKTNPQNSYNHKRTRLKSYKKTKKLGSIMKPCDISARIDGHKIF